jgi:hypothetical protein
MLCSVVPLVMTTSQLNQLAQILAVRYQLPKCTSMGREGLLDGDPFGNESIVLEHHSETEFTNHY